MLIDAHCHFNSLSTDIRDNLISSCRDDYCFIDSSIDTKSSLESAALSEKYSFVYTSLGFHPFCGREYTPEVIAEYKNLIDANKKIVAVGEIGLDYKAQIPLEEQVTILTKFIGLAKDKDLAIVIHSRFDPSVSLKAGYSKILNILDGFFSTYQKVIFHCFSYSSEFLEEIIEREGFVSFSLNILRKNKDIISSLKKCPLSSLLLETDSPYMRVKNIPSNPLDIIKVYSQAALIKGVEEERLRETVISNASRLFSLNT